MPDPIVTGSLITAGGSLLGGALGSSSASKAANKDYRRQKEFAKNSIRWKVEDAKRAGLHPLFALGGGASFSPSIQTGSTDLGSGIGEAAAALGRGYERSQAPKPGTPVGQLGAQSIKESQSRILQNEAQAALALSQAKRMEAQTNYSQDGALFSGGGTTGVPPEMVPKNRVTPKAPDQRSRAPGDNARQAGKNPTWQRYQYGPRSDQWMDIPFSDEGPFEEFGPAKAFATFIRYLQNRKKSNPLPIRRTKRRQRLNRGRRK